MSRDRLMTSGILNGITFPKSSRSIYGICGQDTVLIRNCAAKKRKLFKCDDVLARPAART